MKATRLLKNADTFNLLGRTPQGSAPQSYAKMSYVETLTLSSTILIKMVRSPYASLVLNFVYAIGNCIIGFFTHSWWFITIGAYYTVLAITRFSVLQVRRKADGNYDAEFFARKITGILLVVLSFCIVGVNILSVMRERGTAFHEIIMITIATYTFTKITIAIIGMVKAKYSASPVKKTLRNISLADASVSVFSMQRSMLVSFPGMVAVTRKLKKVLLKATQNLKISL